MVEPKGSMFTIRVAFKSNAANMSTPGDLSEGMMIGNDAELNDWGMDGKMDEIRFSPVVKAGRMGTLFL